MIVISHSWEFIPKGSSHFTYNINGDKSAKKVTNLHNTFNLNNNLNLNAFQRHLNNNINNNNCTYTDETRSINESITFALEQTFVHHEQTKEKWHLKQNSTYTEDEIYIKDGTVIVSSGSDYDSKVVQRCYTFESPVIDGNWFNFKSDLDDNYVIKDALCIFELQKLHVFFPNGADYHINLSFKLKNCWKLRDALLLERYPEADTPLSRLKQQNPVLYTLSHPLNELKPVLCRFSINETKTSYWRENIKLVIIDVIESLDLVLAYSYINNLHYIYRISDCVYTESDGIAADQTQVMNMSNFKTPMAKPSSANNLSMSLNQSAKRRLSVSPIVSSLNNYAKLSLNTPTTTQNPNTLHNTLHHTHHHINPNFLHRNFSPMAALSRSPSCSSSPAYIPQQQGQQIPQGSASVIQLTNQRRSLASMPNVQPTPTTSTSNNIITNTCMTPSIDPIAASNFNTFKTPNFNNAFTPVANSRLFTPQMTNTTNDMIMSDSMIADQQPLSEHLIELLWCENLSDFSMNEKAIKFFTTSDFYNQKYVCYLIKLKNQLRCLKLDFNQNKQALPSNQLSFINAKDAINIESRNLMVIIDLNGSLVLYSGLSKLCKIHLQNTFNKMYNGTSMLIKSPIISPIKVKLSNLIDESETSNDSVETPAKPSSTTQKSTNFVLPSNIQNEYLALFDSTGSRFSVKSSTNRQIRLTLNEITTCKLVKMCFEAFKSTLNKDIYYEIIQQWLIHRYTINDSTQDQLSLFFYLIINLCGCFDMHRLELDMPFLFSFQKNANLSQTTNNDDSNANENTSTDQMDSCMSTTKSTVTSIIDAKRVKTSIDTTAIVDSSDWESMINSEFVQKTNDFSNEFSWLKDTLLKKEAKKLTNNSTMRNTSGILYPYLKHILYTLHLIYEESKLYRSLKPYTNSLLQVLYLFAHELNLTHYQSYYEHDNPVLLLSSKLKQQSNRSSGNMTNTASLATSTPSQNLAGTSRTSKTSTTSQQSSPLTYIIAQEPPSLHKFLFKLIDSDDEAQQNPYPVIHGVSVRTLQAIKIYALISLVQKSIPQTFNFQDYLDHFILKINFTGYQSTSSNILYELNTKTKFDLYKSIFRIYLDMQINHLDDLYDYSYAILFPIFESIHFARENPSLEWPSYAFDLIGRNDLSLLKANKEQKLNSKQKTNENEITLPSVQTLRKEDEDGMAHVFNLEAFKTRFSEDLRLREVRSCLQSSRPTQIKLVQGPDVSDHDFVEEEEKFLFCLCQRTMSLPLGRAFLTLHTINPIPTEPVNIPELNLKGKSVTKKTTIDLTRIEVPTNMTYWPQFHNGVAAGLTIHSQAKDLSNSWIKSHLAKNLELTNEQAGFLYGLGLTGHLANFSMLNVHDALTRRHDLTNISILLGLAASKISSMDLSVIRLISMHIRALMPPVEIELEIPYNIQIAAILSLGLVYAKSANKHISYVLLREIGRLPGHEIDKDVHSFDREAYSLSAGLALGLVLLEKGKDSLTIMDSTFTDELYHYMVGGHKERYFEHSNSNNQTSATNANGIGSSTSVGRGANGGENINSFNFSKQQNNSHIREGESINVNVTSPGATIALGLIYFNSCDKSVAEWFASPDSAFLLDTVRPDFLLLRTLARNLIMWKHILPTKDWIVNQLPSILKTHYNRKEFNLQNRFSKMRLDEKQTIEIDDLSADSGDSNSRKEAFLHIIAGACMSIGLKFAGSLNNDAYHTLIYWTNYFIQFHDGKLSTENCFCVVVLSLAMVMAGSGDLAVLRICRFLRSRVGPNQTHVLYGSHMACSMALGLLFMGGGHYTLKTDSLSVALMICAFYPHFPIDSNDNRFHLQAFRHLHVLASERRLLLSKDIDTNECCHVPIEITLRPNEHHGIFKYYQMTPCLLPEIDKIKELRILGPRYYTIRFSNELSINDLKKILNHELYVKQKNGYFSYTDDPKDEKAFNIRNFLNKIIVPRQITPELLESITNEEHINLFAKMLSKTNDEKLNAKTNRLLKIIYESVIQETFDFVGVILLIDKESTEHPSALFIQEIKLLEAVYRLFPSKNNHIISNEFLALIVNGLQNKIRRNLSSKFNLIKYYLNGEFHEGVENLIYFCVINDINRAEILHYSECDNLTELFEIKLNNVRPEKLLILYQAIGYQ